MSEYTDKVIEANGSTSAFLVRGDCDIIVTGLTAGLVKLQFKLPKTAELITPTWIDFPGGTFNTNVAKTIFMAGDQVKFKLVGVGNNAGVYCKISR